MDNIINFPCFWVVLTIIIFKLAQNIKTIKYFKKIPPIIVSVLALFFIISSCNVSYAEYNNQAQLLTYMLFPATIALAYPLVTNFELIKKNKRAVCFGVLMAIFASVTSILLTAKLLGVSELLTLSIIPKSITTPIAIELSKTIGGSPELTVCIVVITGILGGLLGHKLLRTFKIKHNLSIGLSIGAASHVFGTSKCIEKQEPQQVAAGGLTIVLVAIASVVIVPLLLKYCPYILK